MNEKLPNNRHFRAALSRRDFLLRAGTGFGGLALSALLAQEALADTAKTAPLNPMAPKSPMIPAKAKSVIFLFMYGGPSQVDTFDPKPGLTKFDGKTMKVALPNAGEVKTFGGAQSGGVPLMKSPFAFQKYGKSGIEVSDLFPNVGKCVDDICFIRSVYGESNNHAPALFEMNTGTILQGSPSMGSWVTYGLGSENQNLPGFVVMLDSRGGPIGGAPNWGVRVYARDLSGDGLSHGRNPDSGFEVGAERRLPTRRPGFPETNKPEPSEIASGRHRFRGAYRGV